MYNTWYPVECFYQVVPVNQSWAAGRLVSHSLVNFDEALTVQLVGDDEDDMEMVSTASVEIQQIGTTELIVPLPFMTIGDQMGWDVEPVEVIVDVDGLMWITSMTNDMLLDR